jgi:DUF2934 family protein
LKLDRESPFYQNVQTLAQYLYVMRGCKEGKDLDNWLEAEAQLRKCAGLTESQELAHIFEREWQRGK